MFYLTVNDVVNGKYSIINKLLRQKGNVSMSRKGMNIEQLNSIMKRCREIPSINYVVPVIHVKSGIVTGFTIHTYKQKYDFNITNNPDKNFDLYVAVNQCLDKL